MANNTEGKIKDLLNADSFGMATRLILVNAIYFKADWKQKFDANETKDGSFFLEGGRVIQLPMMHAKMKTNFVYSESLKSLILELPYKGDRLSMVIILPSDRKISELEKKLDESVFSLKFEQKEILIQLPKFKMEQTYSLTQNLKNLGVEKLFTGQADLSGMDGSRQLYASSASHKAVIEVNEEGSEAAAATSVIVNLRSLPLTFKADHPFFFFIRDKQTGVVLFMGRFSGE